MKKNHFQKGFGETILFGADEIELDKNGFGLSLNDLFYLRNLKNRELWLSDEITDTDAADFLTEVREINRQDFGTPVKEREPIRLFIDSPGGDVVAGLSIIDTIGASITPVYTINISRAYSMAFHVMITGDRRFAFNNSSFLLHDGSEGGFDSSSKFRDRLKFNDVLEESLRRGVIGKTKITKREYEVNMRREWYMLVPEALELGVIDGVVEDFDQICSFGKKPDVKLGGIL